MDRLTEEDLNRLSYFIGWKGDVTRWCGWEEKKELVFSEFPLLEEAFKHSRLAEEMITAVQQQLEGALDEM